MLTYWIGCVLLQAQLGMVFWLPIIISLAIVVGGLILNAFIAGKQFERMATKIYVDEKLSKKVDIITYCEDKKTIHEKINDRVRKEVLEIHMKQFSESYGAVEDRLSDIEGKQDEANKENTENYRLVSIELGKIAGFMSTIEKKLK